ncbi:MAG TPA: acyl carrier protein [Anaerolineae bacterium]|nr:acyl carrier protein [Anaerolineae bacterium]
MDTFERVKAIIVDQLGVEADRVVMEASFREDLEADSLDLVELIMAFEEEFGGEISDEEAQSITTVAETVAYLEKRI